MSYGITHKLFGFVWKGQMKLLYPSATAYATVMSDVAAWTGATTVALMLISKFFFQVSRKQCLFCCLHYYIVISLHTPPTLCHSNTLFASHDAACAVH